MLSIGREEDDLVATTGGKHQSFRGVLYMPTEACRSTVVVNWTAPCYHSRDATTLKPLRATVALAVWWIVECFVCDRCDVEQQNSQQQKDTIVFAWISRHRHKCWDCERTWQGLPDRQQCDIVDGAMHRLPLWSWKLLPSLIWCDR